MPFHPLSGMILMRESEKFGLELIQVFRIFVLNSLHAEKRRDLAVKA
jgi:hypothetical protein